MKLKMILTAVFCFIVLSVPAYAREYYVDVNAGQTKEEGTKENPFTKIQKACDLVEPGDIVLVAPGVYYESVTLNRNGTKEAPIVFRATEFGENKVIITAANKDIREKKVQWKLEDKELMLYSVPYHRNVASMLYNGAKMLAYSTLEELKVFECWYAGLREAGDSTEGAPHGFYFDDKEKKLYVRLDPKEKYGSVDPNKNLMAVGGPYYDKVTINGVTDDGYRHGGISTDSYNFGIMTEGSANVVLYGFTFEAPGWCGVFVRAHDVTVSNCWFKGCLSGVLGGRRSMHDRFIAENITVEHCDWNLWPTFEDAIDKLHQPSQKFSYKYYWWAVKGTDRSIFDYEAGSFVAQAGRNWIVRNNYIYSCLDGLSYAFTDGAYQPYENSNILIENGDGVKIYQNRFENCLDNAIEVENHGRNIEIYDNEFIDIFLPISWQPLGGTPWPTNVSLHHNIFNNSRELSTLFKDKGGHALSWLKFGAPSTQWARNQMRLEEWDTAANQPVKPIWLQDKGFMIYNNTVYMPNTYTTEIVGTMLGVGQQYNNSVVYNNIVYCIGQQPDHPLRQYIIPGEFTAPNGVMGFYHEANMYIASNPEEVELNLDAPTYTNRMGYYSLEEAGLTLNGNVMELQEGSKGRGAGLQIETERRDTTDLGAVPYGENWHIAYSPFAFGDLNCDRVVDLKDIMLMAQEQGNIAGEKTYRFDMNFDGKIDDRDLALLWAQYAESK